MKKFILTFIVLILTFALVSCRGNDDNESVISTDTFSRETESADNVDENSSLIDENDISGFIPENELLTGIYLLDGTESGYEFYENKVRTINNGKMRYEDNNYYELNGNELTITFVGDGVLVEGLIFILSEDKNSFIGSDWEGSYTFIKQN